MASIKELYSNDKIILKSKEIPLKHQPEFDILDFHCYGYNERITMEDLKGKNRLFLRLQREACGRNVFCKNINVAFNIKCYWICKKKLYIYAKWSKITDLSKKSSANISAKYCRCGIDKKLNYFEGPILLFVFNLVKNKQIIIRAGPDHERKIYNYANIIKNFMYKNEIEPIVPLEYFEHVKVDATPFCIHCGLFQKIQNSMCWCNLCNFLRFAGVFTRNIEKLYHRN